MTNPPAFPFPTEGIFFKVAEDHYRQAMDYVGKVKRWIAPRRYRSFDGFQTDEGLGLAIAAVTGWAMAIEARVNALYNMHCLSRHPSDGVQQDAISKSKTDKLKELFLVASLKAQDFRYWPEILDLFRLKDEMLQLQEPVTLEPRYAPALRMNLSEETVVGVRFAAMMMLGKLGELYHMPTNFLGWEWEWLTAAKRMQPRRKTAAAVVVLNTQRIEDDIPY